MYKRKDLIEVTSCNDPICNICEDESISHLRPIGTEFKEYYNTYSMNGESPWTYKTNEQENCIAWRVIGYYKGKDGLMHEELKRIN